MSACETVRKKSVREKAREILILSLQKLFPARNLRRIKSRKTWQQLTSKVSYLCLACATDEKTASEKTAAEKKMAAVSDRSNIAKDLISGVDTPAILANFDPKDGLKCEADTAQTG